MKTRSGRPAEGDASCRAYERLDDHLNPKTMWNNVLVGYFNGFWAIILPTFGVRAEAKIAIVTA